MGPPQYLITNNRLFYFIYSASSARLKSTGFSGEGCFGLFLSKYDGKGEDGL
jgi:hypothetical protein